LQTRPNKSPAFPECEYIKSNDTRCQSPALRGQSLCFFHHPEAREIHRMKQVALRLHPNKVAMLNFAGQWPKNPSKEVRKLLTNGFQLIARIDARSAAERTIRAIRENPRRFCLTSPLATRGLGT